MRPIFQQCNNPVWVKWRGPWESSDVVHFSGLRLVQISAEMTPCGPIFKNKQCNDRLNALKRSMVDTNQSAQSMTMCARSAPKIWKILTIFITNCGLSSNSVITQGRDLRAPSNFVHASVVFNRYKCRHRIVYRYVRQYITIFFQNYNIPVGARAGGEAPKSQAIRSTALVSN